MLPRRARGRCGCCRTRGCRSWWSTNQRGIARGRMTRGRPRRHPRAACGRGGAGGRDRRASTFCPHERRRATAASPATGMFERAARDLGIDLAATAVIGDRADDMEAAARIGALRGARARLRRAAARDRLRRRRSGRRGGVAVGSWPRALELALQLVVTRVGSRRPAGAPTASPRRTSGRTAGTTTRSRRACRRGSRGGAPSGARTRRQDPRGESSARDGRRARLEAVQRLEAAVLDRLDAGSPRSSGARSASARRELPIRRPGRASLVDTRPEVGACPRCSSRGLPHVAPAAVLHRPAPEEVDGRARVGETRARHGRRRRGSGGQRAA